jgi:hypothetical protein
MPMSVDPTTSASTAIMTAHAMSKANLVLKRLAGRIGVTRHCAMNLVKHAS